MTTNLESGPLRRRLPSSLKDENRAIGPLEPAVLAAKIENLERGLLSRTVIGQAQGILIERHKITADVAFRVLAKASCDTNRKLHDVATELVLTGELTRHAGSGTLREGG